MYKGVRFRVRVSFDKVLEWEKRNVNNPDEVILGEDIILNAGFTQTYFLEGDFDKADDFYRKLAKQIMRLSLKQPKRDRIV